MNSLNNSTISPFEKFNDEDYKNQQITFKSEITEIIDNMGFSRYNILIFTITALVLICCGAQELMSSILLSIIKAKTNLTEYDLAFITTIEYTGYLLSAIIVNIFLQFISSRRSIQLFTILTLIFTGLSLTNLSFYLAVLCRFFIGLCLGMIDILVYINLLETMPTKIRGFISSIILVFFPIGQLLMAVFSYFMVIEDDHNSNYTYLLLLPFSVICCIIILILFIQESPRKLIAENKLSEGLNTMKKISVFNRKQSKEIDEKKLLELKADKPSFFKSLLLLFNEDFIRYTLIFWILAFMTGIISNGVFFIMPTTAPKLAKKGLIDVIKSVSLEIPSNFIASLLIENRRIGRLLTIKISYCLTILICISCFIAGDDYWIINSFLKFFITICANVLLVYCSEIYTTKIRTFGLSIFNFWKRIAFIISPFLITYMDTNFRSRYPAFYIFLPLSIICFLISLLLKMERRGLPLE